MQGWHPHANMHVYVVYDHHDVVTGNTIERVMRRMGEPIRNNRYSAQPMLPSRIFNAIAPDDPVAGLARFALNTAYADSSRLPAGERFTGEALEAFREMIKMPGMLGYIACSEAHMLPGDQADDAHESGLRFAQMPGAVEIRGAYMVDVHNRTHAVNRVRGETAEILSDCDFGGRVFNALRMLMDVTADRVPQDQAGYDARYPSAVHRPDLS